ncbi:DUF4190 domain-containing protein [Actinomadura chokoriensis]|uniref:Septum formation family protein n=1 Tax=Actinomadura chokoriensis TaxID=454156 RepID=A0ABV4QVR6_9ACTN
MTAPPPDDDKLAWAPPDAPASDAPPPGAPAPTALPGSPPPPPPFAPLGPVQRRTNRFAVFALVTGLLGMIVLAVAFAVTALVQTGRRGEKGKGLAVGALAVSAAWVAAVSVAVTVGPLSTGSAAREDGKVAVTAMRPGDCFSEFEEAPDGLFVRPLPCTTPHQGEVSAEGELPDMPYPGRQDLGNRAWTLCRERTEFLERSRYGKDLQLHTASPDEDAWKDGNRTVKCVMRYTGSGLLPAPLDQTMETKSQYTTELSPGDCVKEWDDNGDQPLIPCTKKHKYEVLAVYTVQGDKYPGAKQLERRALDGCVKRGVKVWGAKPPFDIADVTFALPDRGGWEAGSRLIFCLVTGRDGPLTRSVVPH